MDSSRLSSDDTPLAARFAKSKMPSLKFISLLIVFLFLASAALGNLVVVANAQSAALTNQGPSSSSSSSTLSSPEIPTSSQAIAPGDHGAYPMDIMDSNPLCCNYIPYTPSLIQEFYNSTTLLSQGITGKGITIAIVDAYGDPGIRSDLAHFDQTFGLPAPPSFNVMCVDGPCNYSLGVTYGWSAEISIDVEWAHAMAPGANINLYIASNNDGPLYDADLAAVEGASGTGQQGTGLGTLGVYHNNIISNSWGGTENYYTTSESLVLPFNFAGYPWIDQVFQEAAARGITVFASSGDGGAFDQGDGGYETLPYGGLLVPADDPFVTSVGGTSAYINVTSGSFGFPKVGPVPGGSPFVPVVGNATGTYGYETSWSWLNDNAQRPGYSSGTGGGFSSLFSQPAYQQGPGVPNNGVRGNPDVAWDADPHTGVLIYGNVGGVTAWYEYGGTSLGAPSWAGVTALLDQKAGRSLGFLNPTFYSILNNPSEYAKAFHQITFGNNDPYSAGPGWNPTTGIGTPNIGELANIISSETPTLSIAVTNNIQQPVQPETPTPAYTYGSTITLMASINGGTKVSGPVLANITSQFGALIARNIPMTWDSVIGQYVGSYTIKSSDPAGEWMADVKATSAGESGIGYNQFVVGDGINILSPFFNGPGTSNPVGSTISLQITVENAANTELLTTGNYKATFYLNYLGGPVQGSVPLTYNATAGLWEANYKIPSNVLQGTWVIGFSGTDSNGNQVVVSYTWIPVGIYVWPYTDSYFYVHGQTMTIYAITSSSSGTMIGTLSYRGMPVGLTHLAYNSTLGVWSGSLTLPSYGPNGFYTVSVFGSDGQGNYGGYSEVVDIESALSARLALSSQTIPKGGNESFSIALTSPSGAAVRLGFVMARIYRVYPNGTQLLDVRIALTYSPSNNLWLGVLSTSTTPLSRGSYLVQISAFDPYGDYGAAYGTFNVVE